MVFSILAILLWLIPAWCAAQQASFTSDRLSAMRRIMPASAFCTDLDWEPVSYCRLYSKGATLEIWSGHYGPGVTLSFDAAGVEGIAMLRIVRAHFGLAGIPFDQLNHCIGFSEDFRIQVAGKPLELRCRFVELGKSVSLEILPEPVP